MIVSQVVKWKIGAVAIGLLVVGTGQAMGDYVSTVSGQNPILYLRLNEATNPNAAPLAAQVDNTASIGATNGSLPGNTVIFGETSGPALTPAGGFNGFDSSNSWVQYTTGDGLGIINSGDVIQSLVTPKASMGFQHGSTSMWFRTNTGYNWSGGLWGTLWAGNQGASGNMQIQMSYAPDATNGSLRLDISGIAATQTTGTYTDGEWHHVAATWVRDTTSGDGTLTLYVDGGTLAGGETVTTSYTGWDPGVDHTFSLRHRVGKQASNSTEYKGFMDEWAVWDNTLTDVDIQAQYQAAFGFHPGDANGDGMVNLADLQILGDNWQSTTATWSQADFTGDDNVNLADLQILGDNWGYGVSPDLAFDEALAQLAIPEPATAMLFAISGLLAVYRRR